VLNDIMQRLLEFVDLGARAVTSRFSYSSLRDLDNRPVQGINVDLGTRDNHFDYRYTGYNGILSIPSLCFYKSYIQNLSFLKSCLLL
jgi:hypothetical protein